MIRIENLAKRYGDTSVLGGVTYHFPESERIALVGANGAGKTTLLRILGGEETPDDGRVVVPGSLKLGHLPQEPNPNPAPTLLEECVAGDERLEDLKSRMDDALERADREGTQEAATAYEEAESAFRAAGGYSREARAQKILSGLGFPAREWSRSPLQLSGGLRMRLELAKLFMAGPEFLILDEPTNHLDLPSLAWVESYLKNFPGTLLFVSHDRALLNRLATVTLHLKNGALQGYKGGFDDFLEAWEAERQQREAQREQLQKKREHMETFVARFGAKATKASQARSRQKMIARVRQLEEDLHPESTEDTITPKLPGAAKTPRIVYTVEQGAIGYDEPLLAGVNLEVERGSRIAVIGANGIGKSTFLKTVAGRISALAGRFEAPPSVSHAYFAQDQKETFREDETVLDGFLEKTSLPAPQARTILGGFLFRGDDVFKQVKVLSGGEISRLGLAAALSQGQGLVLLDEPTNHLDMASVESLISALETHDGTMIFVSHDRYFIDSICTHVLALAPGGRSRLFEGNLEDYRRLAASAGFPDVLDPGDGATAADDSDGSASEAASGGESAKERHQRVKELKNRRSSLQTQLKKTESAIDTHRQEIAELEQQLLVCAADDFTRMGELQSQRESLERELSELEDAWLEQSEELDSLVSRLDSSSSS